MGVAKASSRRYSLGNRRRRARLNSAVLPSASAGATLGERYEVERLIGRGASARVYRAVDRSSGRLVALKEYMRDEARGSGFLRELGVLFEMKHPHILECYDVFIDGMSRFLVYELMDSGSLRDLLLQDQSVVESIELLLQAGEGVAFAHARGLIHRDLKPENILLNRREHGLTAKVGDFGVSVLGTAGGNYSAVGSPAYMAPEQFYDRYDHRVDIYALGIMLFELLSGARPFVGNQKQLLHQHLHSVPKLPGWIPEELTKVVMGSIAKSPDERFATAESWVAALREALSKECQQLEKPGWPAFVSGATGLAVTRCEVLVRAGKSVQRFDRRGRYQDTLASVCDVAASGRFWAVTQGDRVTLHDNSGSLIQQAVEGPVRIAVSQDGALGIVERGGAYCLHHGRKRRLMAEDSGAVAITFCGPESLPCVAVQHADSNRFFQIFSSTEPIEQWPLSIEPLRLVGHYEQMNLMVSDTADPLRWTLVTKEAAQIIPVDMLSLSCDGANFIGVTPGGVLCSIAPSTARIAQTRFAQPLAAAVGTKAELVWLTKGGTVNFLRQN
ncbi:MAG: serine/threonine-protein kinase [Myxococcota bacterium]